MKRFFYLLVILAIYVGAPLDVCAHNDDNDANDEPTYRIHVMTMGPGEELFTRFGHVAFVVEDQKRNTQTVYNYGTFNFSDPGLQIKYARGFLNYWLSTAPFSPYLSYYFESNRDVWLQTLNLTDAQATAIANGLAENAQPENRYYAYRHFLDNCCTRIRDMVDTHVDGVISKRFKKEAVSRDFRYWTDESLRGYILYKQVILYSLGPAIDQPLTRWDEEFLPSVLHDDLNKVTLPDGRPLVATDRRLLKRKGAAIGSKTPLLDIWVVSGLVLLLLVGFGLPLIPWKRVEKLRHRALGLGIFAWSLLAGLGGLMLVLYWTITTHYDTHYNENLLITPVLHLWLLVPATVLLFKGKLSARKSKKVRNYLLGAQILIGLVMLLKLGPFIQGNWGVIITALVCNTSALVGLRSLNLVPKLFSFK